jgi:hypothetical protein
MSKIKVMPASKEMLAKQLRESLKDITVTDERKEIVGQLVAQLMLLERLQEMRYVVRAAFWKCNYHIFDYLRLKGQTGRETCAFDRVVSDELKEVLDGLVYPETDNQDDEN